MADKHFVTVALAAVIAMSGSLANANQSIGTLRDVQGQVLVQSGKEFRTAKSGTPLFAGDKLVTMNGASASLTLTKENCALSLKPNQMLALRSVPCSQLTASIDGMGLGQAETLGGLGGLSSGVVTGLVVAGVVGGTIVVNQVQARDDARRNASPN
jgi:hypothetical protein